MEQQLSEDRHVPIREGVQMQRKKSRNVGTHELFVSRHKTETVEADHRIRC